ncbi:MAG: dual specificity protein phosphatase family protein [bacterium]|nr:dual specificity protein phosphatase family protein [bacterium]
MRAYLLLLLLPLLSLAPSKENFIKNFHKVDNQLYRSAQPSKKEMQWAEEKGIKTIINLRNVIDDKHEIKGTNLIQVRIPLKAKKLTYDDIVITLSAIEAAEKPVLIHCLHGSDRTGCMVAAYQMYKGMEKQKAITQFLEEKYGYNRKLFPNILELLESIDVNQLRKDIR